MLLLLFNQIGEEPEIPPRFNGGFEIGSVNRKPLLKRILEARESRLPKLSNKVKAKTKKIEIEAAKILIKSSNEQAFNELMKEWVAVAPKVPQMNYEELFMAQVAFRIRQLEEEEEESILVLLLS